MKKISKRSLDLFKKRTLDYLAQKKEILHTYPIAKNDLVYIKKCAICGSTDMRVVAEVYLDQKFNFFTTNVCNDCLFTFRSISPSFRWFQKCWKKIKTEVIEVFNPEIEAIRKIRYEKYYKILSKYLNSGSVLDIGAGYGTGSQVFKERGYEVESLEPEDNKAQYIRHALHIKVYQKSIESFLSNSTKKRYDLIMFTHCLEHLDSPAHVFDRLKKLLKPSGVLYIEVPVLWNFVTWTDALYLTHKSNFGEEHLIRFVQNHGFVVLKKVRIKHSTQEPKDFGLILQLNSNPKTTLNVSDNVIQKHTIDNVFELYRKNLPVRLRVGNTKIVYSIPRIEQFYCTIKFENYTVIKSPTNPTTLNFKPKFS